MRAPLRHLLIALILLWAAPAGAQAPAQVIYYLGEHGSAIGPLTLDEAKARIRATGNSGQPVWSSQTQAWRSVGSLPEFRSIFTPSVDYYIGENGEAVGPFTLTQLQERARAGTLARGQGIWKSDSRQWALADSLPELAVAFPAAPVPPPVVEYYIGGQGATEGPMTLDALLARIAAGSVPRAQAIWKSDTQAWAEAESLPELAAAFPAAPSGPPVVEYFVDDNGTPTGPLTREAVLARIADGTIARAQQVWKSDTQAWAPAESLAELAAAFPAARRFLYAQEGDAQGQGPISLEELIAAVAAGTIGRRHLINEENTTDWYYAQDIPELQAAFPAIDFYLNVGGVASFPMPLETVIARIQAGTLARTEWVFKADQGVSGSQVFGLWDVVENIAEVAAALPEVAAAEGAVEYQVDRDGRRTGTLTFEQVADAIHSFIITRDTAIWRTDTQTVEPAENRPELVPVLEAAVAASYKFPNEMGQLVPVTLTKLALFIQNGRLSPDALVAPPGSMTPSVRAGDVPGQAEAIAAMNAMGSGEANSPGTQAVAPTEEEGPGEPGGEYYIAAGDVQEGPLLLDAVRQRVLDGTLAPDQLVFSPAGQTWTEARGLPELAQAFAALGAAQPGPSPADVSDQPLGPPPLPQAQAAEDTPAPVEPGPTADATDEPTGDEPPAATQDPDAPADEPTAEAEQPAAEPEGAAVEPTAPGQAAANAQAPGPADGTNPSGDQPAAPEVAEEPAPASPVAASDAGEEPAAPAAPDAPDTMLAQASQPPPADPALVEALAAIASAENPTGAAGTLVATRTCFLRALDPLTPEERAAFPADVRAGQAAEGGNDLEAAFPGLVPTMGRLDASHPGIAAAFEGCI